MVHVTPCQVAALLATGAVLAVLAMTHTAQTANRGRESELQLVRAQLRKLHDWKRATDQTLGLNNAGIQLNAQVLLQQGQVQTQVVTKVGGWPRRRSASRRAAGRCRLAGAGRGRRGGAASAARGGWRRRAVVRGQV